MSGNSAIPEQSELSEAKRRLLAQRLRGASAPLREAERIKPRPSGARTPIGPDQHTIWLESTLFPDLPTYNEIVTVHFRGELDAALLEHSFNRFLSRHEAWRTTYTQDNGEILQVIHPVVQLNHLELIDLSALTPAAAEAESNRLATEQARRFLDLEHGPLFRAVLVRIAPGDCRLHLSIAHLIFDGFSLRRTFLPELAAIYSAFVRGQEPVLPPVDLHYADYTAWRHRQLESPAMQAHLDFWRHKLAGDLPVLRLPADRPRPAVISHRGAIERFSLSRDTVEALRHIGRQQRATFYMTLFASLKALLFRCSGQEDVLVGSLAEGRKRPELERMMGYILDVFALRTHPRASMPFAEYLQQVRHGILESFAHCDAPFARVVESLHLKRDLSHLPVFQVLFVLEPAAGDNHPWSMTTTAIETGSTKFDLYIQADEHANGTDINIAYSTELFDRATIRRLIGHWQTVIEAICANPACTLGALPILTPAEREQTLVYANDTARPLPELTLHDLVAQQIRHIPQAPAITFGETTWTYAELDRETSRLATHLARAGCKPGELAAVFLDRSAHLVAGLLGILRTGAAYLPLDPGTPAARVALCLEDAQPAVLLTQRARLADLPATSARILILEDILAAPMPDEPFKPLGTPDDLAYIIHTSGSTGRPKGVELAHRGVVNLLLSMQREPGFTATDTLVAITTISFDIAVLELFLPLISGGRVVIAPRETALDPARLAALLKSSRCTVLQATPATWSALVGSDWPGIRGLRALSGGESLNRSLADRLLALGLELWNVYGPTETTIWSTIHKVQPGAGPIPPPVSIGRPIDNTTAFLLDPAQQPVPINVPGELYLGGAGVARGYRNRPGLTAERFVTPAIASGARLYRTGDYAVRRADGTLESQGRADNQVKIRGYRIELEDVEVNLAAHPQVALAAARAWPDESGGNRLTGYLVGVNGQPPSPADLRHFLRERVAEYMVPSDLIVLDVMPLTSNGKIDRKQLPEPVRIAASAAVDIHQPQPELTLDEQRLARIWSELLNVTRIARTDSFFDLGGHSLLLLRLLRAVNREFSTQLEITDLFRAPTLEKLAALLERSHANATPSGTLVPLNPRGHRRPLFMIHSYMLYGRMPAALGSDQPFYGIKELAPDSSSADAFIDTLLDEHVRQIRKVQPEGPYQIAGWCFAGLMACEIARRLEATGNEVSSLLLLDSWCPFNAAARVAHNNAHPTAVHTHPQGVIPDETPNPRRPSPATSIQPRQTTRRKITDRLASVAFRARFFARRLHETPAYARRAYLGSVATDFRAGLSLQLERGLKGYAFRALTRLKLPKPAALRQTYVITYDWLRRYQVKPFRGDITLLRPADVPVPPGADPDCGWGPLTSGRIRSLFVPGDRRSMFLDPNLAVLAAAMRDCMDSQPPASQPSLAPKLPAAAPPAHEALPAPEAPASRITELDRTRLEGLLSVETADGHAYATDPAASLPQTQP